MTETAGAILTDTRFRHERVGPDSPANRSHLSYGPRQADPARFLVAIDAVSPGGVWIGSAVASLTPTQARVLFEALRAHLDQVEGKS